ncbi:hypothetical protein LIER_00803 [Lithospermum erythrorhizon]|uniref:Uncharacterized protein n=1 Tax=Lithospermum erythrorhizon TaxID=34254 RepID=A0AAV3NL45_LITER
MASEVGEKDGVVDDGSQMTYKDALLDGEPQQPQSDFHPSVIQHDEKEKKAKGNNDGLQNLKTSLFISGALIAVLGAIIVLVKKINHKDP